MILFNKLITKGLIRLCGCTGWSVNVLCANPKDRFPCVEAHMFNSSFTMHAELQPSEVSPKPIKCLEVQIIIDLIFKKNMSLVVINILQSM